MQLPSGVFEQKVPYWSRVAHGVQGRLGLERVGVRVAPAPVVAKLHRSPSWVSRRPALVRELPAAVQDAVRDGHLGAPSYGSITSRQKPSPSWPDSRAPQHHAPPSASSAHQWRSPPTSATDRGGPPVTAR
jgi:hypothetical protein